ncbi:Transcriptional adapter 2-alpha [Ordospora colligata]
MNRQIGTNEWTLLEETLFVEGLEIFGIGNWIEIEKYVGRRREIKQHFYKLLGIQDDDECTDARCKQSNPYRGCISSYMPLRKDFEMEYLNDQEAIITNLRTDNKTGKMLAQAMLDSYVKIVMFRKRWKYAIFEKMMVDLNQIKKSRSIANEMDMHEIKCIAPYMTKKDFNTFFNGIYIEKYLYRMLMKKSIPRKNHSMDTCPNASACVTSKRRQLSRDAFLSENEKKLCKSIEIPFDKDMNYKTIAINHMVNKTRLSIEDLKTVFQSHADAEKAYQLLHDQG